LEFEKWSVWTGFHHWTLEVDALGCRTLSLRHSFTAETTKIMKKSIVL